MLADVAAQPAKQNAAAPPSMRAGEFIHYYANLLTLFRTTRSPSEIEALAHAAVAMRATRIEEFATRMQNLQAFFANADGKSLAAPHLDGWDSARIDALRARHGGLLLAVFHYGEHRHVLSDLAALGVAFVAPIAKRNYFDAPVVFSAAPPACAEAAQMLEVEDRAVGRKLISALRRGRAGLIYVDGNMGPDGHLVAEGGTEIDFLGHRISVKTGIARMAQSLRMPILPLLAVPSDGGDDAHRLLAIDPILPDEIAVSDEHAIMQRCYNALAVAVQAAPEHWEFAFCLHRWLRDSEVAATHDASDNSLEHAHCLGIDASTVIDYPREDGVYWLHVGRQRAYRLPEWSRPLYALLKARPQSPAQIAAVIHDPTHANATDELLDQLLSLELVRAA